MDQTVLEMTEQINLLMSQIAVLNEDRISRNLAYVPGETQIGDDPVNGMNSGDTAWMLTSTALVLFMTIPGIMLYYSGIVRSKNVLSTVMQIFSITCVVTVLWMFFGYSLAFGPALPAPFGESSPVFGNASRFWLRGMHIDSFHQNAPNIPEAVYCAYQLTFAIITPALIVGAIADRMKYTALLLFTGE